MYWYWDMNLLLAHSQPHNSSPSSPIQWIKYSQIYEMCTNTMDQTGILSVYGPLHVTLQTHKNSSHCYLICIWIWIVDQQNLLMIYGIHLEYKCWCWLIQIDWITILPLVWWPSGLRCCQQFLGQLWCDAH